MAYILNFQSPKFPEEIIEIYNDNKKTNLDILLEDIENGFTEWTVSKDSDIGDEVFLMCAKTSKDHMRSIRKKLVEIDNQDFVKFLNRQVELYDHFAGKIIAKGKILTEPIQDNQDYYFVKSKAPYFSKIGNIVNVEPNIDISEIKDFIMISRTGSITKLDNLQLSKLNNIVDSCNKDSENIDEELSDNYFPEEDNNTELIEGASKKVSVNKYERSPKARNLAINYHGTNCVVCGFCFEDYYGEIGKDYIHIHHIIPLNVKKEEYRINYKKDLVPVCPNCHAMLHRKVDGKDITISELKKIIVKKIY